MRRVADGESFTVTVHGQPVADLVPHQRPGHRRRRLVPAVEFDAALARLPSVDAEQWKRDIEKADDIFGDDLPTEPQGGGQGEVIGSVERKVLLDISVIIEPPPQGT